MWVQYIGEEELIQLQYKENFLPNNSLSFHKLNIAEARCRENGYTYSLVSNTGNYANEICLGDLETIIIEVESLQEHFDLVLQHKLLDILTLREYTIMELCNITSKNRVEVTHMICWLLYTGICSTVLLGTHISVQSIIRYTLYEYK